MAPRIAIAVIGGAQASAESLELAEAAGRAIATKGAVVVCGGLTGVMEAAARGARAAGGHTVGILPSFDRASANPHIEFAIATGMSHGRNLIVVASADAVIALPGESGTLSEIALALTIKRPVVVLRAWREIAGVHHAESAEAAAALALSLAEGRPAQNSR